MSQENVEIVRQAYDAYERSRVDGIIPFLDEEIEWRNPPDSPVARVYHGHGGVREWEQEIYEVIVELHFEPTQIDVLSDGRLLAILRARVKGASGIEMEVPFAHVIEMRAGKVVAFSMYSTVDAAREAVGLEE
jgi:ketosteroid isomerase-like protein